MPERSESDYILNDIVPLLAKFGYPKAGDRERIKIDTVPTYGPTGKITGHMDIVYYHEGEPLLVVEAKRRYKGHDVARKQAVRSCKIGGKICLVLPEGFFSNSQDEFLRKYVAKHCRVLAIISLPRGVFKKGKTTKAVETRGQIATMKMSVLYAEKVKPVIDGEGINVADNILKYPVFMANIEKPKSTSGEVCEWLKQRLDMVLEEWEKWQSERHL